MFIGKIFKSLAPVIAVAMAAGVSGCDGMNFRINGEEGKPLSELDMSGTPPSELVLLGPDEVRVTTGEKLAITVDGDAETKNALRFTLKDGTLGILRKDKAFDAGDKVAIVNVTMPALKEVVMAGSGKIHAAALATQAKVVVAGSGHIETPAVEGESLEVTIAGSGNYRAAGNLKTLDLTVAGSGSVEAGALKVDRAKVTIAGSGSAALASDGEVEATIMGSGDVKVTGRAKCTVSAMGSGRLTCESGPAQPAKDKGKAKE